MIRFVDEPTPATGVTEPPPPDRDLVGSPAESSEPEPESAPPTVESARTQAESAPPQALRETPEFPVGSVHETPDSPTESLRETPDIPTGFLQETPDSPREEREEERTARSEDPSPPRASPSPARNDSRATIKVIGVGGGGGNAVNRMIENGVCGVEFIVANTDVQVLDRSLAPVRIQIGRDRTGGLGCGGDPEIGRMAARDDMDQLIEALDGADMVFITVGEGGGTGTGAAPVVACVAQEIRALCVAVATKPLGVEGRRRRETADEGIRELRQYVDTLICVPNDRVVEVYGEKPIRAAFRDADDVVRQAVQGISDLIQLPGEINLDFADVRSAMRQRGDAVMGVGIASGESRVEEATRKAISSPLLEDTSIRGATSIILNVTGSETMTLKEVQRAAELVREAVALETEQDGNDYEPGDSILLGTALDPTLDDPALGDRITVTVVATGFPNRSRAGATPQDFFTWANQHAATGTDGAEPASRAPAGQGGRSESPSAAAAPERPTGSRVTSRGRSGRTRSPALPAPSLFQDEEAGSGPVADLPPVLGPDETGDDRWGDLDTPAYLVNRRDPIPE